MSDITSDIESNKKDGMDYLELESIGEKQNNQNRYELLVTFLVSTFNI